MKISHPYWYVEIENPNPASVQWKSRDNRNIQRFALSNLAFHSDFPYSDIYSLDGGTDFANQGLEIVSFERSMDLNWFEKRIENIPFFEIKTNRLYSESNGAYVTRDWLSRVKSLSPNFEIKRANVKVWLCSGTIAGFNFNSTSWISVSHSWEVTWPAGSGYPLTDDGKVLMFSGVIQNVSRDRDSISFICESNTSNSDTEIGEAIEGSENGSSEIIPFPFGTSQTMANVDKDIKAGFPFIAKNIGGASMRLSRSALGISGAPDQLIYIDQSGYPAVIQNKGNIVTYGQDVFLSSEIPDATLESNRNNVQTFALSQTEAESLGFAASGTQDKISQTIFSNNGEVIAFHGMTPHQGSESPPLSGPTIVWADSARLESRGWGYTNTASHTSGTSFNDVDNSENGAVVDVVLDLPVSEVCEYYFASDDPLNFRGISGSPWNMMVNSETPDDRATDTNHIVASCINYGPEEWPVGSGNFTSFFTGLLTKNHNLIIRPPKPAFDNSVDKLTEVRLFVNVELNGGVSQGDSIFCRLDIVQEGQPTTDLGSASSGTVITLNQYFQLVTSIFEGDVNTLFDRLLVSLKCVTQADHAIVGSDVIFKHTFIGFRYLYYQFLMKIALADKVILWNGNGIDRAGFTSTPCATVGDSIYTLLKSIAISDVTGRTNITTPVAGALTKKTNLRDVIKKMAMESRAIVRDNHGDFDIQAAFDNSTILEINEENIFLDEKGNLDLDYDYTDSSELVSEILVKFRFDYSGKQFQYSMSIGANRFKTWRMSDYLRNEDSVGYRPDDWAYFPDGFINVENLITRCIRANIILGLGENSYSQKIKTYEMNWVRDRAEVEKFLADAIVWNTQVKQVIKFNGPLSTETTDVWNYALYPGRKIKFAFRSGSPYMDSEFTDKTYLVTKNRITPYGQNCGCYIEAVEIPKYPGE